MKGPAPVDPLEPPRGLDPLDLLPYEPSRLELLALRFLGARHGPEAPPTEADDPVHVLTRAERAAVGKIVRRTVLRSFLVGAISAGLCVCTDLALQELGVEDRVTRWSALGAASLIATVFEVTILFRDHLLAVLELARATGARVFPAGDATSESLARALARAALELPDPVRAVAGIDPRRGASRIALLAVLLLYKAKRGASNFVAKQLVARILPRGALRALSALVALPITGAWNALVSWRVLREARIRAVGPSAVCEVLGLLLPEGLVVSDAGRIAIYRAIAAAMVLKRASHPNLLVLLDAVTRRLGEVPVSELDDVELFLAELSTLRSEERTLTIHVLETASILDGRLRSGLRGFLARARMRAGLDADLEPVLTLERAFARGDPIDAPLRARAREPVARGAPRT